MAVSQTYSNLRVELTSCDAAMAAKLRTEAHYERQRPIAENHVFRLANEIENGHFIEGTQIHICELGRKQAVVNGNHTLEAIMTGDTPVVLSFLYTKVKDEEEIARIYANHDIGKARNWAAAIKAAGMFDEMDANQQFISAYGSALMPILSNFQHLSGNRNPASVTAKLSRDLRIDAMREYRPYAELYHLAVRQGRQRLQSALRRQAVFAVGLETFKAQPSIAVEFWEGIAKDDGLRKNDPRKLLMDDLLDRVAAGQQKGYQARIVACAWNAFFEGREVNYLRVPPGSPFILKGTKWGATARSESAVAGTEGEQRAAL